MAARKGARHATHEDEFGPEVTEGGSQAKIHEAEREHPTLEHFLSEQFGDYDKPAGESHTVSEDIDPPPTDGSLPSLAWIKRNFKTKSAAIRWLVSRATETGDPLYRRADIAKLLGVKYQHVRNVATTQLKRGPNEDWNLERRKQKETDG
jgi:hypothetical protein